MYKKIIFGIIILICISNFVFADDHFSYEKRGDQIVESFAETLNKGVDDTLFLASLGINDFNIIKQEIIGLESNNQFEYWYNIGNDFSPISQRKFFPIYSEITYIDVNGFEKIKFNNKKFSDDLKNVSIPKNTEFKSETYFNDAKLMDGGKVFIGDVMTWYITKEEVFKNTNIDDFENYEKLIGRDLMKTGLIRFSSPIYDNNIFVGVVVLSMDYRFIQSLTKHIDPTKEELVVSTAYNENYILVFDSEANTIIHPKPDNIRGVLETGELAGFNSSTETKKGSIFNLYFYDKSPAYQDIAKTTLEKKQIYISSATDVGGRTKLTISLPLLYNNPKTNFLEKGVFGGIMLSVEVKDDELAVIETSQETDNRVNILFENLLLISVFFVVFLIVFLIIVSRKSKFSFGKLNRKIILMLIIFALIPFLISSVVGVVSMNFLGNDIVNFVEEENFNHESERLVERAIDLSEKINLKIDDYLGDFKIISVQPEIVELVKEVNKTGVLGDGHFYPADINGKWIKLQKRFLQIYEQRKDVLDLLRLFHSNGYIINGVAFGEENSVDYKGDKSWFKDTLNPNVLHDGEVYISPISIARRTQSPAIRYSIPIEVDGERQALLVANFSASSITKNIEEFRIGENGYAMFVDFAYENAEGEILGWPVIISTKTNNISYKIDERYFARANFEKYQLKETNGIFNYVDKGIEYIVAYNKVNDDKEWYVFVIMPKEEFFALSTQVFGTFSKEIEIFNLQIIMLLLILIIPIILFSYFVSHYFSKPIEELKQMAQEIEKGNFNVTVDIKSKDELGELGRTFNKTAKALGETESKRKEIDKVKTEFLSITSHELRSPMTPMRAQLQMLLRGYFGKMNPKQKDSVEIVLRNTERLDRIIQDFLEISRIEAARLKFDFVETSLKEPIQNVFEEIIGFMPKKKIKYSLKMEALPVFEVDPDRVMQVFRNVLTNATKFVPDKGKGKIDIFVEKESDHLIIIVKDNGAGIAKENQERIFEPFFQEEQTMYRKYGGTGLGLAICKGIIESQNGKIWLESEGKDKGSTFYFTVPYKPVKEIAPIKLLFSQSANKEEKIKELFSEILGPLGNSEFDILKKNNKLSKADLNKYIDYLQKEQIVFLEKVDEFKKRIDVLMGYETVNDRINAKLVSSLGKESQKYIKKLKNLSDEDELNKLVDLLIKQRKMSLEKGKKLKIELSSILNGKIIISSDDYSENIGFEDLVGEGFVK